MALKRLLGLASVALTARAQSSSTAAACPSSIAPAHSTPSVAPGFRVQVVANNLRSPRSIEFDKAGGLLVVEQGHGISRLQLSGDGACVRQSGSTQVVVDNDEVRVALLRLRHDDNPCGRQLTFSTRSAMA
jgi:glucose/arabinose dehydrogenase